MIGGYLGAGFLVLAALFALLAWRKYQDPIQQQTGQKPLQVQIWLRIAAILTFVGVFLMALNQLD